MTFAQAIPMAVPIIVLDDRPGPLISMRRSFEATKVTVRSYTRAHTDGDRIRT